MQVQNPYFMPATSISVPGSSVGPPHPPHQPKPSSMVSNPS